MDITKAFIEMPLGTLLLFSLAMAMLCIFLIFWATTSDAVKRLRENIRIFRDVRAGIDANVQIQQWKAMQAAADRAGVTPQEIEQALKAVKAGYHYVSRDYMAQESGLDADLHLAHDILKRAVLAQ